MSALYAMRFAGQSDTGAGAIYIGKGQIVGIDVGNIRFHGTYTEQDGTIKAAITMSAPSSGLLVTGQPLPPGTSLQVSGNWPVDFANGQPQQVMVAGRPVHVTFEKIGDVP